LDLDAVRAVGHGYGATVNDVVLDLVAAGLRGLLLARGEPADVELHATVSVARPATGPAARTGNRAGIMVVGLPLAPADPVRRLAAIRAETARTKRDQVLGFGTGAPMQLAGARVVRYMSRHQHLTNTVVSNVVGPPVPVRLFGARVRDLLPLGALAGNLSIGFLAFSYAGTLTVTVRADADRYPDLPELTAAMSACWAELAASTA
jgi:hypothetical protein